MMNVDFLKKALDLARLGKGYCAPNPAVGAVVVKDNKILATGYHRGVGCPHAEVEAFNQIPSTLSQGADLYVTLEPCCHQGKTPPCTDAIIRSGISRVFYGLKDPDPRVSGKGAAILAEAGIACTHVSLPEIIAFYQSYCYWQADKKPFVTAKLALSLDAKIAGMDGKPIKISGKVADDFTHQQRKYADALLTTARTIYKDDPQLNVRLHENIEQKPVYILDRALTILPTARIFKTSKQLTLFHSDKVCENRISVYRNKGVNCIAVPEVKNQKILAWDAILNEIGKVGVQDLWVEAGARCFESLILGDCLDQAYLYFSPKYIGVEGIPAFSAKQNLFEKVQTTRWDVLGTDAVCQLIWKRGMH